MAGVPAPVDGPGSRLMMRQTGGQTDFLPLAAEERRDLSDFLDTLDPTQWAAPSLCAGWSVHDVVAHVVSYEETTAAGLLVRRIKGVGRGGPNEVGRAAFAGHSSSELVAYLRAHLVPHGITSWFGGGVGLTDGLIHHQDIRRALGRPRAVPADRVRPALGFALNSPKLPSRRHVRDLTLVATDLDWVHGEGTTVTGPAEALLMAAAGRQDALGDLDGPGAALLADRLRSHP